MKDLIITAVILLIVFGADALLKRGSRKVRPSKPIIPKTVTGPDAVFMPNVHENKEKDENGFKKVSLIKNAANVPKKFNYETLETLEDISINSVQKHENTTPKKVQKPDLIDNRCFLTFDVDEIYKGFIYSEIFHRKYK